MLRRKRFFNVLLLAVFILPSVSAQGKETLAVLDFTTEAVSEIEMNAIVEFLSAELFNTDKYIVIDVSQRETILSEMEFSMSGCSDDSCALEIGKMLSAEMIVTGNLSKVGSRYLMSVKMLQTETSRTMGTANGKYGDLDELIDGLETIAFKLAGAEREVLTAEKSLAPETANITEVEETAGETADDTVVITEPEVVNNEEKPASSAKASKSGGSMVGAITCTVGGVAALGTGGYFIYSLFANTLPAYREAQDSYYYATGDADYNGLFEASADAYDEAFVDFVIGVSAAGIGTILTTIGIILFPPADDKMEVSFSPVFSDNPGMIIKVSY